MIDLALAKVGMTAGRPNSFGGLFGAVDFASNHWIKRLSHGSDGRLPSDGGETAVDRHERKGCLAHQNLEFAWQEHPTEVSRQVIPPPELLRLHAPSVLHARRPYHFRASLADESEVNRADDECIRYNVVPFQSDAKRFSKALQIMGH
jgi:hypothetical protein